METRYGLTEEVGAVGNGQVEGAEQIGAGVLSQYAPLVKEVVDGIKTVFAFFGDKVPADVVKKVQNNDRFRAVIKDPKALVVIGQALRREFGDDKARDVMRSFGVNMVIKPVPEIRRTPDIPGVTPQGNAAKPSNAKGQAEGSGSSRLALKGNGEHKGRKNSNHLVKA